MARTTNVTSPVSKIKCLVCGREFDFLPPHLRHAHGITADEYREAYDIAAGEPLSSARYSAFHAEKMRRLQATGKINYQHLTDAVAKSREAKLRPKRGAALEKQREIARQLNKLNAERHEKRAAEKVSMPATRPKK